MTNHNQPEHGEKKTVTIIVNGKEKTVEKDDLTYDEVVALAFNPPPTGDNILITIVYRRGHGDKPEGSVVPGGSVKVKDGMIFDVTATDRS
jgi:hypothetical protein